VRGAALLAIVASAGGLGPVHCGDRALTTRGATDPRGITTNVQDYGATGDGTTDDTAAILAARDATGADGVLLFPAGTYVTTGIVFEGPTPINMVGASPTTTILRAKPGSTGSLLAVLGPNNGSTFTNFSIDISEMPDVAASRAIYTYRSSHMMWSNVRVTGVASNKVALYVDVGSYVTTWDTCDFHDRGTGQIVLQGLSPSDGVTTQTFLNCYFAQMTADQAFSTNVFSPVMSGELDKFRLSNVQGFTILGGDVEGSGTYLNLGPNVAHLASINVGLHSFTGRYQSGGFFGGMTADLYGATPFQLLSPERLSVANGMSAGDPSTSAAYTLAFTMGRAGLWLGTNAASPSLSNYAVLGDGGAGTLVNAGPGGGIGLRIGDVEQAAIMDGHLYLTGASLHPSTDCHAPQDGSMYQGAGVPNDANGNDGDFYFRTDTPRTAHQRIYVKASGAWVGIL
jgi:hypothetical protein